MMRKLDYMTVLVLFCCCLAQAGCVTAPRTEATHLLEQDYLRMTDTQLADYERKLTEELINASRDSHGDVGIGFSFGSWGGSSGYSVRTDQRVAGGGDNRTVYELRLRRDDVRAEMRRRGLLPE